MKTNLRRVCLLFVLTFFLSMSGAALAAPGIKNVEKLKEDTRPTNKVLALVSVACNIYPAITDLDECVDKAVHGILAVRGVKLERQDEIIRAQKVRGSARYRTFIGTPDKRHQIALAHQVMDVIEVSCGLPPAITDMDSCMDMAYHGIFVSRDAHSGYLSKGEAEKFFQQMAGDLQGVGAEIALTEEKSIGVVHVMPGSPAERAGVLDGDRIIAIVNGAERTPTSSLDTIEAGVKKIKGKPGTSVTLEILRGEQDTPITFNIVRAAIRVAMVKTEVLTAPGDSSTTYAYVKLIQFGDDLRMMMVRDTQEILRKNPSVKGIIFDVRGNPGGSLGQVHEAVDALADSPEALVSIRGNNGIHAYGTAVDEKSPEPQPGDITDGLPMVVLVDGHSASASEIFAGSLKELERAVIIGKRTWGKGTVQSLLAGRDGDVLKVTIGEYLVGTPDRWVAVQCVGVEPDIAYEAEVALKPKKEMHDCDIPGSVVSGGARSSGNPARAPLATRNPALYHMGEQMLEAIIVFDHEAFVKKEALRKQLKIALPKEESEEGK
jgi:carboxyl-terminal processing protease